MKSSVTLCLSILLTACLVCSDASNNYSLWGKKLKVIGRRCFWQLNPDTTVPALKELTVCTLLRVTFQTKWTGFVYKAPGERQIELGLQGSSEMLSVFLFGKEVNIAKKLKIKKWYSICVTWSDQTQRLRVYIDGDNKRETTVDRRSSRHLAPNGTLTLGMSHFVSNGEVQHEDGMDLMGEIGLFRMWSREWSAEEIKRKSCADGNVLSWDTRQWKSECSPELDSNLYCEWSLYKIKLRALMDLSPRAESCPLSPEDVTRSWLENIFPRNVTVHDISVSSPSQSCHVVNKSAALHQQQPQESVAFSTCVKCFSCEAYVTVDPVARVDVIQATITALLNVAFSHDFLNLTADPYSISVLPVESFSAKPEPAPTISNDVTTSSPTQSRPTGPSNTSTTGEPLDFNETSFGPDTFFRVNLNLSLTGNPTNPKDVIEKWVKQQLEVNKTMTVLNLIIKQGDSRGVGYGLMTSLGQQTEYNCTFHVQDYSIHDVNVTVTFINDALASKYENDSYIIQTTDVVIKHIRPDNCLEDTTSTIYGIFVWPDAFPQTKEEMGCTEPTYERASRFCKLDIETDTTSWADPDMSKCSPLVTISDLENITVTTGNMEEVVDMIQDLVDEQLGNSTELSSSDLDTVVEKLNETVNVGTIRPAIGANIINIVADVLLSQTDMSSVASIVLNLTERMGNNIDFGEESANVTAPSLALSMVNVAPGEFSGLTFGVSSISPIQHPKIFLSQSFVSEPLPDSDATISLPAALHDLFPPGDGHQTRIQFQFFGTPELFPDPNVTNGTQNDTALISYIVSASVNSSHVSNLKDPVVVTMNHQRTKQQNGEVRCVFWDFQLKAGQGGWNNRGCKTQSISSNRTSCQCDHLTHFAVLLDVFKGDLSETDNQILTVISYLGCGISSIFLGITLLTYLVFEKLRRDYPSKILINLSAALLGLCMLFLLNSWLTSFSNYSLCIATAASLHYFLLASFTWMGLEALHMYFALVKVFNIYVPSYILKFCAVGWGFPLVIVSLVLAIDKDAYGSAAPEKANVALDSTDQFCWLQNDVYVYVTVVAYFLLILLCNIFVFIVVLIQIKQMGVNKPSANNRTSLQDLRAVASLTVLLGLTWGMGFFSVGPGRVAMLYLFCIFNSLQGFFIFVFHCLMKENVRKQWRIHLSCGHSRPSDSSDWSHSLMVGGGRGKKKNFVNSDSVVSDNTTTRKVSDTSTGSTPNHQQRV